MPEPKKPARKPAAKKTSASKKSAAAKKATPKRAAPRSSSGSARDAAARRAARETPLEEEPSLWDDADDDVEEDEGRPVAVGGGWANEPVDDEVWVDDGDDAEDDSDDDQPRRPAWSSPEPVEARAPGSVPSGLPPIDPLTGEVYREDGDAPEDEVERPLQERLTAVAAVVLIVGSFLTIYTAGLSEASAWSAGGWRPIVTFLGFFVVATVGLRAAGVKVSFPIQSALLLEGAGWAAFIVVIMMRFFRPSLSGNMMALETQMWFVAVGGAVALAMVGGSVSRTASFVMRPRWLQAPGGKLGAGLLAFTLLGGVGFGVVNGVVDPNALRIPITYEGMPPCMTAAGLPLPKGIKAVSGAQSQDKAPPPRACNANLTTRLAVGKAFSRYRSALKGAGFEVRFADKASAPVRRLQVLKGDNCMSLTFAKSPKKPNRITAFVLDVSDLGGEALCNLGNR